MTVLRSECEKRSNTKKKQWEKSNELRAKNKTLKRKLTVAEECLRQKRCISTQSTPREARASHCVAAAALQLAVKRKHIAILARASKRSAKDARKNKKAARQFYERIDKASKLRRQLKAEKEKTATAQRRYNPI